MRWGAISTGDGRQGLSEEARAAAKRTLEAIEGVES